MNDDEVKCVVAISTTLKQVVQAISSIYAQAASKSQQRPNIESVAVGESSSDVTLNECSEFVDLIRSMVEQSKDDFDRIQAILFGTDPSFVPTLTLALQFPPSQVGEQLSPLEQFQVASIQCLKQAVASCCVDLYRSPRRNRDGSANPTTPISSPLAVRLSNLCGGLLTRCNLPDLLVDCLSPTWPSSTVRQFAAELLFACVLRINSIKEVLSGSRVEEGTEHRAPHLDLLVNAIMEEPNTQIRSFTVASIREVCGAQPLQVGGSKLVIETLIRLSVMDPEEDVRSMSAESLDTIFRNEPQLWQLCEYKKEIATAVVGRLEDEESGDVLLSILRLTETLLIADAALALGKSKRASPVSFTETFLNLQGDQHLIACIRGTDESDAFCARCLRLLIEFAPYYRAVAFAICQHYPSLAKILRTCVSLATDQSGIQSVSDMRFELSLALSLMLCQDPRVRELLVSELAKYPMWMGQLRGALLANLNSSSLRDFSGIRIIDVMGDNLSDIRNVEWDHFTQPSRPSRASLEAFMEDQSYRWIEFAENSYVGRSREGYVHDIPEPDPRGEAPETRLTFILITNTVHNTLNANTLAKRLKLRAEISKQILNKENSGAAPLFSLLGRGGTKLDAEPSHRHSSPGNTHPEDALESIVRGGDGDRSAYSVDEYQYDGSVEHEGEIRGYRQREAYIKGPTPAPTRTSLIREWKAHPEKFNVIKNVAKQHRQAAAEAGGDDSVIDGTSTRPANFFGSAAAPRNRSSYREENFEKLNAYTDPYRQPTEKSFKAANDKGGESMGSMLKKDSNKGNASSVANGSTYHQRSRPFSKFDASLKMCKDLGEHHRDLDEAADDESANVSTAKSHFETVGGAGSGFVKRMAPGWDKSGAHGTKPKGHTKTWTTEDLREGDLFYFSVPFETMTAFAVDQVRLQAICHLNRLKKSYLVTPHNMKGRRWFIFDMTTHVLPKVISVLKDILELIEVHGEENVRFPMLVFTETDGAKGVANAKGANTLKSALSGGADTSDTCLHSGNLLESLDQIKFYFAKMGEVNPIAATNSAMMNTTTGIKVASPMSGYAAAGATASTSQYLIDLENKIRSLKTREFSPRHDAKHTAAFYEDVPESDSSVEQSPKRHGSTTAGLLSPAARKNAYGSPSPAPTVSNTHQSYNEDDEIDRVSPAGTAGRAFSQNPYY